MFRVRVGRRRRLVELLVAISAVASFGALAGCTSYSGSPAHQVSEWASVADVSSNDQIVVQDIAAIRLSAHRDLIKDVTSNCAGLLVDSGTAYGNLPTPDNTLTNQLNVAYEDFASAGGSCSTVQSVHSAKFAAALKTIAAGVAALDKAERRLAADGVH